MMHAASDRELAAMLARVLRFGTQLASILVASGLALQWFGSAGANRSVTSGLVIFLLLPCIRVVLMLSAFMQNRDYRFGAAAALVLLTILLALSISVLVPGGFSSEHEGPRGIGHLADPVPRRADVPLANSTAFLTRLSMTIMLCTDRYTKLASDSPGNLAQLDDRALRSFGRQDCKARGKRA